jgi:hypothetical protein
MIKKIKTDPAVKEEKKKPDDDWMTRKWRPMMAIMYMFCCLADFFIFPIMFTVVQFWETAVQNDAFRQWVPITLQGGGLFHVAMGAVLGVSAYGRTQEKLNGATAGAPGAPNAQPALAAPAMGGSTFGVPSPNLSQPSSGFGSPAPVTNSWGSQPLGGGSGFGSTPGGFGGNPGFGAPASTEVVTGFGGKPAPVIPPFPER